MPGPLPERNLPAAHNGCRKSMTPQVASDRWDHELAALRDELRQLRAEQRAMAAAVQELVRAFRTIAAHLGIAAEPYVRKGEPPRGSDIPGFA